MATQILDDDPFGPPPTPSKRHSSFLPTTAFVSEVEGYAYPHRKSSSASTATTSTTLSTPSSPSKASAVLPLQHPPPPIKPNAHPYAIKSTSTGVLSRSSSNTASPHYKESHRYLPPPSPSPTTSSFTGGGPPSPTKSSHHHHANSGGDVIGGGKRSNAYRGHRYSQSLTDVSGSPAPAHGPPPRPLPVPPNFVPSPVLPDYTGRSLSASPTKSARFLELQAEFNGEETTPKQKERVNMKRAETAPFGLDGPTAPFIFPPRNTADNQLLEDPKSWTPAEVATYLRSSNLPNAEALANLVLEKQIGGRAFLRIASVGSDERSDLHEALRGASRTLRQSSLRGRIWGYDATGSSSPYGNYQRERSDSESSVSSTDGFSSNAGRVKGIIASLERTSSISSGSERDEDEGPRSRSRSASPSKHRPLPSRARVGDLFAPLTTVEDEDADGVNATVKAHGYVQHPSNGNNFPQTKELPRLLPLPPTFTGGNHSLISPMNTGSTVGPAPLLSPANTGSSNPSGTEFGYRAHPSPGIYRSKEAASRMLPIPPALSPVIQQPLQGQHQAPLHIPSQLDSGNVLHHPVPQRNVGTQGIGIVDNLNEVSLAGKHGEEPSMEELLSKEGGAVSGVKAWEMDVGLGDTVKKVPASAVSGSDLASVSAPASAPPAEAEKEPKSTDESPPLSIVPDSPEQARPIAADLSFVNGRSGRRVRGVRPKVRHNPGGGEQKSDSASQSEGEGSKASPSDSALPILNSRKSARRKRDSATSVLSLFNPPTEAVPESAEVPSKEETDVKAAEYEERERALDEREAQVGQRERAVEERERAVGEREAEVGRREEVVASRSQELDGKETDVGRRTHQLDGREAEITQREEVAKRLEGTVNGREDALSKREKAVEEREAHADAREKVQNAAVDERERKVREVEAKLQDREAKVEKREQEIEQRKEEEASRRAAENLPDSDARQRDQVRVEEEDTFTLASRLIKRIISPVLGERLAGYLLRPLDVTPEDGAQRATASVDSEDGSGEEAVAERQRPGRRDSSSLLRRRDASYLVFLGIGAFAVVLRVLMKRVIFGGAGVGIGGLGRGGVAGMAGRR